MNLPASTLMRRYGRLFSLLLSLVLTVSAAAEDTMLVLTSPPGEQIGRGTSATYTPATSNFSASNFGGKLTVGAYSRYGTGGWSFEFWRPGAIPLKVGVFAVGAPPWEAEMIFEVRSSHYSGRPAGTLEIKKLSFDADGKLVSLWAIWEVRHTAGDEALRGELRYHADSTVAPHNQKPGVSVRTRDVHVPVSTEIQLFGLAGDDDLPAPATFSHSWSVVSGPGAVAFGDPLAARRPPLSSGPGFTCCS
jgi:hypothetical protein